MLNTGSRWRSLSLQARVNLAVSVPAVIAGAVASVVTGDVTWLAGVIGAVLALAVGTFRRKLPAPATRPPSTGVLLYAVVLGVVLIGLGVLITLSGVGDETASLVFGIIAGVPIAGLGLACLVAMAMATRRD